MIPNLLTSISGRPKSGKTHLALTWPEPIAVFSFDLRGAELLLPKFEGKQIDIFKFPPPISIEMEATEDDLKLWNEFKKSYREAMESGKYQTIVVDPATMVWEVVRNAFKYASEKKGMMPRDYGTPNSRMAWVLTAPLVSGMNVVSVNYVRPVYEGEMPTSEIEIDGFKRTEGLADFVVFMEAVKKGKDSLCRARIEACRFDRTLNGFTIDDPTYDDIIGLLGIS